MGKLLLRGGLNSLISQFVVLKFLIMLLCSVPDGLSLTKLNLGQFPKAK